MWNIWRASKSVKNMKSLKWCQKWDEHETVWKIGGAWSCVEKQEEPEKVWNIWIASKGVTNMRTMKQFEK